MAVDSIGIVTGKVELLSAKFGIAPEAVRALLGDFLEALHEASFKGSPTEALTGVYFSLGPEAAWHFFGIVYESLAGVSSEFVSDERGMWIETAQRLDGRMKRFATICDRWSEEKSYEIEQARLDAEHGDAE